MSQSLQEILSITYIVVFVSAVLYLVDPPGFKRAARLTVNGLFNIMVGLLSMSAHAVLWALFTTIFFVRKAYRFCTNALNGFYAYKSQLTPEEEEELNECLWEEEHLFI